MCTESILDTMRANKFTYNSAFIEFTNRERLHNNHAFCFYEGIDDSKYYNSRIENVFGDTIIKIIAGGKKELIKLHEMIENGKYQSVCKMFFIDRDFDESIYQNQDMNTEDIYETEGYSFENYYVCAGTIRKMLVNEFNIEKDEEDSVKCIENFAKRLDEYNDIMLDFNAILFYHRRKKGIGNKVCFGDKKLRDFAEVKLDCIRKSTRHQRVIAQMKEEAEISDEEMSKFKKLLVQKGDLSLYFRGKNQMEFLEEYVNQLILNKDQFFYKKNISVDYGNEKHKLTWFCNYAYTPDSLKQFIDFHHKKFKEKLA